MNKYSLLILSSVFCVSTVQTEAPVNLTYTLTDAGGDELGHNALLSWTYPVPSHLQYGWITLVYELQYRRVNEPNNWKVHTEVITDTTCVYCCSLT